MRGDDVRGKEGKVMRGKEGKEMRGKEARVMVREGDMSEGKGRR